MGKGKRSQVIKGLRDHRQHQPGLPERHFKHLCHGQLGRQTRHDLGERHDLLISRSQAILPGV